MPSLRLHSDLAYVSFGGLVWDAYGWDEVTFYDVSLASPPGQNNVEGAGSHDGTYYWFEFRKALDSGDGCDWSLSPGVSFGSRDWSPELGGDLLAGLWDNSIGAAYQQYIRIRLSA